MRDEVARSLRWPQKKFFPFFYYFSRVVDLQLKTTTTRNIKYVMDADKKNSWCVVLSQLPSHVRSPPWHAKDEFNNK